MSGLDAHQRRVGALVATATLMVMFDTTVTAVAVPRLTAVFHTDLATVQWVTTAYALALVAVMPLSAWVMRRFGARRVYLTALALFVVGSALAASAWNVQSLIAFRAVQGLGGGFLQPIGMALAIGAVDDERRGRMMSVLGLPLLVGPVFGPVLGGTMLDTIGWRWLFGINVPIGVLAVVAAAVVLRVGASGDPERAPLDRLGVLMLAPGGALLVLGLSRAGDASTVATVIPAVLGAGLLAVFARRSWNARHPLLNLRLVQRRNVRGGVSTLCLFACGYFGSMLIMPLYVQAVRGDSATTAGLVTMGQAIMAAVSMQVATRLVDRVEPRRVILSGIGVVIVAMSLFAVAIRADIGYPVLVVIGMLMGLGVGGTMMPSMVVATRGLEADDVPSGTTILGTGTQFMAAIGAAVLTALTTALLNAEVPALQGGGTGAALGLDDATRTSVEHALSQAVSWTYVCVVVVFVVAWLAATRIPRHTREAVAHRGSPTAGGEDRTGRRVFTLSK